MSIYDKVLSEIDKTQISEMSFKNLYSVTNFRSFLISEKFCEKNHIINNLEQLKDLTAQKTGNFSEKSLNNMLCKKHVFLDIVKNEIQSAILELHKTNKESENLSVFKTSDSVFIKCDDKLFFICSIRNATEKIRSLKNVLYTSFSITFARQKIILQKIIDVSKNTEKFSIVNANNYLQLYAK